MGVRQKLNSSYANGSLLVAGLIGLLTQSWLIFFVALFSLLGNERVFARDQTRQAEQARPRSGIAS